ncbi:Hypothetical_protein [Hexamita inflata]|uniref:Hypothetical_protein n=1 Tax=Hexamita inflata TaxID=28002 RepID=A0AA86NKR2_9EUKA|nr:Hypothetical protein HINF_LOCUS8696 [Hexamita inflata]
MKGKMLTEEDIWLKQPICETTKVSKHIERKKNVKYVSTLNEQAAENRMYEQFQEEAKRKLDEYKKTQEQRENIANEIIKGSQQVTSQHKMYEKYKQYFVNKK